MSELEKTVDNDEASVTGTSDDGTGSAEVNGGDGTDTGTSSTAESTSATADDQQVKGLIAELQQERRKARQAEEARKKEAADKMLAKGEYKELLAKREEELASLQKAVVMGKLKDTANELKFRRPASAVKLLDPDLLVPGREDEAIEALKEIAEKEPDLVRQPAVRTGLGLGTPAKPTGSGLRPEQVEAMNPYELDDISDEDWKAYKAAQKKLIQKTLE